MVMTIFSLVLLFVVLAVGAKWTSSGLSVLTEGLSGKMKIAIGAIFVALSTSLPELFVAISAAFEKQSEVSLGNLFGANVANLSLVIGLTALISGALPIVGNYWRWEMASAFLAGVAPILLMMDGSLTRLDGLILLTIYVIYLEELVIDGGKKNLSSEGVRVPLITRIAAVIKRERPGSGMGIVIGPALMIVSSMVIVRTAVRLAGEMGIPGAVVGLLLVSLGTTLPEFILVFNAAVKKNVALVLGNVLGSVATNATLVVGILALVRPFRVENVSNFAMANIGFVAVFGLFWMFTSSRRSLSRFEGLILSGLFFAFFGLQLLLGSI